MKKKDFEKWAMPILKKAQKILLLEHFYPVYLESVKGDASKSDFTYPYQSITIGYSEELFEKWKNKEYDYVKNVLVHEMCHPLTDGLYAKATTFYKTSSEVEDEREKLTDHIANVILKNKLL